MTFNELHERIGKMLEQNLVRREQEAFVRTGEGEFLLLSGCEVVWNGVPKPHLIGTATLAIGEVQR